MPGHYDVSREYVNIDNYSPFSHINEVSPRYRKTPFALHFIHYCGEIVPVHPDTFEDLGLDYGQVEKSILVFPTSSYRTVYDPQSNMCLKLPLKRHISRGIRDLPTRHLEKALFVQRNIESLENFHFLEEECYIFSDPNYNYIRRSMPETDVWPWFYVIRSQAFSKDFVLEAVANMIRAWMFFAKNDWFLEAHTQNLLVDQQANVYYRDLSDVASFNRPEVKPRYLENIVSKQDAMSLVFDRTFCNQNLDHLFRYDTVLGEWGKQEIRNLIAEEMKKFGIIMPDYSLDFDPNEPIRKSVKTQLVWWRQ